MSLLFAYALGFVVPMLLAGACADFVLRMEKLDEETSYRTWVTKGCGVLLIFF